MKAISKSPNDQIKEKSEYSEVFIVSKIITDGDRKSFVHPIVESENDTHFGFVLGYN